MRWLLVFFEWIPTKWHLLHPAFPSFNNLPVAHCAGSHVTGRKTTRIIILFVIFPITLRFETEIVNPIINIPLISSKNDFESGSRFWWGSKQTGTEPITHTSFTELRVSFEEIFQLNVYCPAATDRRVKWLLAIPTVYIDKIKWTPLRFLWSLSLSIPTVFTYHNFFFMKHFLINDALKIWAQLLH